MWLEIITDVLSLSLVDKVEYPEVAMYCVFKELGPKKRKVGNDFVLFGEEIEHVKNDFVELGCRCNS